MAGRGKKRSSGDRALQIVKADQKAQKGYKIVPTVTPKAFVVTPWNSWTFEQTQTTTSPNTESVVLIDTIISKLATVISLSAIDRVKIKIHAAQTWCSPNTMLILPDLEARFYELSQSDQQIRSLQRDIGAWSKPAKAGYVYPLVDRSEVYSLIDKDRRVLATTSISGNTSITNRVQLLWKSAP